MNELFTNVLINYYLRDEPGDTLNNLSYDQFSQLLKSGEYCVKFSCYRSDLSDELVTEYTLYKKYVIL